MAGQNTKTGGPWQGVWATNDPFDDRPDYLTAAINGYLPDPANGSPFNQRPGVAILNAGASLGTFPQCIYEHTALDGNRYIFAIVDGKVYRANTAAMAAWTDVTPTTVIIHNGATAPFFISCTSLDDKLLVSDGVNKPWIGTSLGSTPIAAEYIEYDGPNPEQRATNPPATTTEAILSRSGTNDRQIAVAETTFQYRTGVNLGQQATYAGSTGSALPVGTIPADTWGVFLVELDSASAVQITAGAANFTTGYATESTAITALPARTVTRWFLGFFTVKTASGQPFVDRTDALAGGASGSPASLTHYYAGEGSPWCYYGPTGIYQGSYDGILSQVATVYARATMEWSEPDDPATGYNQTDFDNQWALTQTSAEPVTNLQTTNAGIFYGRELSWGMLVGTLSVDLTNSTTSDAVSENVGTLAPWTVDQFSSYVYFADAQGRPWRFALGNEPEPIWLAMRTATEQNRQLSTALAQLPQVGWGIVEPNLNVYLYGFPTQTSSTNYAPIVFYCFDAQTGRYNGIWKFAGNQAMATGGIVHDETGTPVLVMAGTNGGTARGYLWKLTTPTSNNWQDNGSPMAPLYAQSQRLGFGIKTQQLVPEVRVLCGVDTPCTVTTITSNGITSFDAQAPAGVVLLSRGTNDTRVASSAFGYILDGVGYTKAAVPVGTAFSAQTVPATKWAAYRASVDDAGVITFTAAPDNTTGYNTEALALQDVPATPLFSWNMGYLTVQAQNGNPWIAGTDALAGGTTGNEAQATTYYAGETSFDGTYKMTFPLNQVTGRGVQVQVSPARTAPASATPTQGQWVLFQVEADLQTSVSARDQR